MTESMPAVHLVHGSEEHLVSEAIDELRKKLIGERPADLVLTEFDGDDAIPRMLEAAHTPAFVDGRRVLMARLGNVSAADGDLLVSYIEAPLLDAVLVISAEGRLPPRFKKAVEAGGAYRSVSAPPPHKRAEWVLTRAKAVGLSLDGESARYLADVMGESITSISSVLTQLRVAFPEQRRITIDEVSAVTSGPKRGAVWDLTDAIDRGDTTSALSYLAGSLAEGAHPLQLMVVLHNHFKRLANVVGRELTADEAAAELGIKRFPAEKAMAQASRLGERGVRRAISLLAQADLDLKGASALPADMTMEILAVKLCAIRGQSGSRRGRR